MTRKKNKPIKLSEPSLEKKHDTIFRNKLKPISINQNNLIKNVNNNVIVFCQGVAGSGKTHIAVGLALQYLFEEKVEKIIITRPIVESGEKLGFLPGTAEEKLHPYLLPILDEISHFIPMSVYGSLKTQHKIEIVPLALMRGRNFHNCFIVADECQNASYDQLKMLITRIGNNSKMVLTGDTGQSDLVRHLRGGFLNMINALTDIEDIGVSILESSDIARNPIIGKILTRLEEYGNESRPQ